MMARRRCPSPVPCLVRNIDPLLALRRLGRDAPRYRSSASADQRENHPARRRCRTSNARARRSRLFRRARTQHDAMRRIVSVNLRKIRSYGPLAKGFLRGRPVVAWSEHVEAGGRSKWRARCGRGGVARHPEDHCRGFATRPRPGVSPPAGIRPLGDGPGLRSVGNKVITSNTTRADSPPPFRLVGYKTVTQFSTAATPTQ